MLIIYTITLVFPWQIIYVHNAMFVKLGLLPSCIFHTIITRFSDIKHTDSQAPVRSLKSIQTGSPLTLPLPDTRSMTDLSEDREQGHEL